MRLTRYQLALSLTLGILAAGSLAAQDPPSRVARLNFLRGEVSFQPPSVDDWSPASLNYPLSTGSHIYTADSGTAEAAPGPPAEADATAEFRLPASELSIKQATRRLEMALIRRALIKTRGNRTAAAKLLELSHRALLYKLREYGLE